MSMTPLPNQVDVRKWAGKGADFSSTTAVMHLPRLADILATQEGEIAVELHFYTDEERRKCIGGQIKASLQVFCQRCLEPMTLDVESELALGIVWSEEDAKRLPSTLEPLIVGEELVDLADVVSEELMLNMPFVNYHTAEACQQTANYSTELDQVLTPEASSQPVPAEVEEQRENPFKILEQLKRDK